MRVYGNLRSRILWYVFHAVKTTMAYVIDCANTALVLQTAKVLFAPVKLINLLTNVQDGVVIIFFMFLLRLFQTFLLPPIWWIQMINILHVTCQLVKTFDLLAQLHEQKSFNHL